MTDVMTAKQLQFNAAMEKYEHMPIYLWVGRIVSLVNITLQGLLALFAFQRSIGLFGHMLAIAAAYILADFINGLVHMYMDNNDNYESPAGPLIANFHLHHRTPRYKENPLLVVYYNETGSKVWLVFLLLAAVFGAWQGVLTGVYLWGAFYFGVLSSVAELSHYLCHAPAPMLARFLGRFGILLSSQHHGRHHTQDNINYAFLNSVTDPVLNIIAHAVYPGYKTTTDTHYARYTGANSENRLQV